MRFDELSASARDRAIDNMRDRHCDDSDEIAEWLEETAADFLGDDSDVEVQFSVGFCQSDHATLTGGHLSLRNIELVQSRILKALEHGRWVDMRTGELSTTVLSDQRRKDLEYMRCSAFQDIADRLRGVGVVNPGGTSRVKCRHYGGSSVGSNIGGADIIGYIDTTIMEAVDDERDRVIDECETDLTRAFEEYVKDLNRLMYRIARDEVEDRNSDENLSSEAIECEIQFDPEGDFE